MKHSNQATSPASSEGMPLFGRIDQSLAADTSGVQLATWRGMLADARGRLNIQKLATGIQQQEEMLFLSAIDAADVVIVNLWNAFHCTSIDKTSTFR
jgi:hypothetical protein